MEKKIKEQTLQLPLEIKYIYTLIFLLLFKLNLVKLSRVVLARDILQFPVLILQKYIKLSEISFRRQRIDFFQVKTEHIAFYTSCFFLSNLLPTVLFLFSFPCQILQSLHTFCFLILSLLMPRFNIEVFIQESGHSFIYSVSQFFTKYVSMYGRWDVGIKFVFMAFVCFYEVKHNYFMGARHIADTTTNPLSYCGRL